MSDPRETAIAQIADRLREQMFAGMPPAERAAREAAMDNAMRKRNEALTNFPSYEELPEQIRDMSRVLREGTGTLRIPEGTPPELAETMRQQFAATHKQPPSSRGVIETMAEQLYNNPVTRAAFTGTEQERDNAIQQASARQLASVSRQLEALGARPPQGVKPERGTAEMQEQVMGLPPVRAAAGRGQPEVAGMAAVLEAYNRAGPEMARRLPGLLGGILSGTAPGSQPEKPQEGVDTVRAIDGTRMGSPRPRANPALAARTAGIREELSGLVSGGRELSAGENIAANAMRVAIQMNERLSGKKRD